MNDFDSANTMVATPNIATQTNMIRPIRRVSGQFASIAETVTAPIGRRRAQDAEPFRAGVEHLVGEDRQQRHRAAEQHREQVERDDAEHDGIVPDIGDAGEECREVDRRARGRRAARRA